MKRRAQLIVDYGSRILTAVMRTANGDVIPCSQEIGAQTARYLPSELFYDPRGEGQRESLEEALDAVTASNAQNFFQRARRLGLRRFWDVEENGEALALPSPWSLLSSAGALADRQLAPILPRVGAAIVDAQLRPIFDFVAGRGLAAEDLEPIVILPAHVGGQARRMLRTLLRRRGFARSTVIGREIAAAMALVEGTAERCSVADITDDDLHVHTVAIARGDRELSIRTVEGSTFRGLGRSWWIARIDDALRRKGIVRSAPSLLERTLTSLITGVGEPPFRLTHGVLQGALDSSWQRQCAADFASQITAVAKADPLVVIGDLCALEPVRNAFALLGSAGEGAPKMADHLARNVASAISTTSRRGGRLVIPASGTLRLNTLAGEAVEIVAPAQLPCDGEDTFLSSAFHFVGDYASEQSFLLHLLWGADRSPEGNATLCALPLGVTAPVARNLTVRVAVHLRRTRDGSRLRGRVEARLNGASAGAHAVFDQEFTSWHFTEERP